MILIVIVSILGISIYRKLFTPNVITGRQSPQYIYIPTGAGFEDVVNILDEQQVLINERSFRWTSQQMNYVKAIKPGKYLLKSRMNNKDLVLLLRSGRQVPVNVVFNNIRTKDQLAQRIGEQIEAQPIAILNLLGDRDYTRKLGFTPENILSLFLPNTYEFYWNTSPDQFIHKMKKEYDKFWTQEKLTQARKIGFSSSRFDSC